MKRVVLFGYHELACVTLDRLVAHGFSVRAVVTDPPADPGHVVWYRDVARCAEAYGIPVLRPHSVKDNPELLHQLRELQPDYLLSARYKLILPREVLEIPRCGALNLHPAMLPRYRGSASELWAMINGEQQAGVTLHVMTERVDQGDIVDQEPFPILYTDTGKTALQRSAFATDRLLCRILPRLAAEEVPRTPQDHNLATYFRWEYERAGAVTWEQTSQQAYDRTRALAPPFPGAFFTWRGETIGLLAARQAEIRQCGLPPGTVLGVDETGIVVKMAAGALRLMEVRVAGADMLAAHWATLNGIIPGSRLD